MSASCEFGDQSLIAFDTPLCTHSFMDDHQAMSLDEAIHVGDRGALRKFIGGSMRMAHLVAYILIRSPTAPDHAATTLDWLIERYNIDPNARNEAPSDRRIQPFLHLAVGSPRSVATQVLQLLLQRKAALHYASEPQDLVRVAIRAHNHDGLLLLLKHVNGDLTPFHIMEPQWLMEYASRLCPTCALTLWRYGVGIGNMEPHLFVSRLAQCDQFVGVFFLSRARVLRDASYTVHNTRAVEGARTRRSANVLKRDAAAPWLTSRINRAAALPTVATTESALSAVQAALDMPRALFTELESFLW